MRDDLKIFTGQQQSDIGLAGLGDGLLLHAKQTEFGNLLSLEGLFPSNSGLASIKQAPRQSECRIEILDSIGLIQCVRTEIRALNHPLVQLGAKGPQGAVGVVEGLGQVELGQQSGTGRDHLGRRSFHGKPRRHHLRVVFYSCPDGFGEGQGLGDRLCCRRRRPQNRPAAERPQHLNNSHAPTPMIHVHSYTMCYSTVFRNSVNILG